MPDFVLLNDWALPVADGEFSYQSEDGGSWERMFSGGVGANKRFEKKNFDLVTPLLTAANAAPTFKLLKGYGHYWDFENSIYSSKGMGHEAADPANATRVAATGLDGGYSLKILGGKTWTIKDIIYDKPGFSEFTVLCNYKNTATQTNWARFGVRGTDGTSTEWKNGVQGAHDMLKFVDYLTSPSTNGIKFSGKGLTNINDDVNLDHVVILPFELTDDQMAAMTDISARFSPLPKLKMRLAEDADNDIIVEHTAIEVDYLSAYVEGTLEQDAQHISVSLSESSKQAVFTHVAIPNEGDLQFYVDADQPAASPFEPTDLGLQALGDATVNGTTPVYSTSSGPNGKAAWTFIRAQGTYDWNAGAGADIASDNYSWLLIVKPTRTDSQEGRFFDSTGTASLYRGIHDEWSVGPGNRGFLTDLSLSSYVGTGAARNATDWFAVFATASGSSDRISFRNLTSDPDTTVNGPIGAWDASTTGTDISLGGGAGFATEGVIHALLHWDVVVDIEEAMDWAKFKAGF